MKKKMALYHCGTDSGSGCSGMAGWDRCLPGERDGTGRAASCTGSVPTSKVVTAASSHETGG